MTVDVVEKPESFLAEPSVVVDDATAAEFAKLEAAVFIPVLNDFLSFLKVFFTLLRFCKTPPSLSTTIS